MDFAFPALFIFLLALPGLILRYSYRNWGWKIPIYRLPLGEEVAKSIVAAATLDLIGCLVAFALGYRINLSDVLILLTGGFDLGPVVLEKRLAVISSHPEEVILYFVFLYLGAATLGLAGRGVVRKFRLDLRFRLLRFDNFWHYALNGEVPLFAENRLKYASSFGIAEKDLDAQGILAFVSCVVSHGARSFVYFGFPLDYFFDREGKLEKIILDTISYEELWSPREIELARAQNPPVLGNIRGAVVADLLVLNATDLHNIAIEYVFGSVQTAATD